MFVKNTYDLEFLHLGSMESIENIDKGNMLYNM